ncbi:hypothetical protein NLX67_13060 [Domibacillus sp. A3M-37]|uniref:hypothetical protein n=1 Tax=Domibacillus sp. A3M-37 TaxID=2962037 RepID=UPI0020B6DB62|nr:hypothetical protein [Domibacillus sp. A3M-37]MCP3763312.1 hypothetical protein [Domibacillus sp. A3M-37]
MIYPHILLILVLITAASVSAADSSVTKWETADYLTDYYEMRIIELMALRDVLSQSDPASFTMQTNRGTTSVDIIETSEKDRQIRITTIHEDGFFHATYYYDMKNHLIVKRTEYN